MEGGESKVADTKHLEFLQAVITRLAGNSFLIKGWSVTLTTAIVGLAAKDGGPEFALVGLVPVAIFGLLDAYYLALERSFRKLFEKAAENYVAGKTPDFLMSSDFKWLDYLAALKGPAVWLFHGLLAAVLLAAYLLLCRAA